MPATRKGWFRLALLALLIWAVFAAATYFAWIHGADHKDFYPWWAAARLRLFEGRDPYSPDTVRQMQIMLYGAPRPPEMDQQAFHYPAQLLVLLFPLWFIRNIEIAAAVWDGLSAVLLLASFWLIYDLREKKMPGWVPALLVIWQYPLLMLFQAQIASLPLFALLLGMWAAIRGRDILAGAVLVLAVAKPELALVPWAVMLLLAFYRRRWKMIVAFITAHGLLFLLSLAVAGWWLPGWLGAIGRYSGYAASTWIPRAAWQWHPLLLAGLVGWAAFVLLKTRWSALAAYAAAVPLGMLLLPQTLVWNLTLLIIPLGIAAGKKSSWFVLTAWAAGWTLFFAPPGWWTLQTLLLPCIALGAVWQASREQSGNQPAADENPMQKTAGS